MHYDFYQKRLICTDTEMMSFLNETYRDQRYLEKLSNEIFSKRLEHLLINLIELDFNGRKWLIIKNGKFSSALIEVFEEFNLRNIPYEAKIESVLQRFEKHTKINNYAQIIKNCNGKRCLFKYLKKEHLSSLLKGEIRLKLASSFKEDGFNIAIQDDELKICHQLLNSHIITENGTEIPIKNDIITRNAFGDYYIGCFSATIDPKLFIMFDYDACFIIKNSDIFAHEVIDKYKNIYKDGLISFRPVEYIDPYKRIKTKNRVEFVKTIDFEYENEYRFVAFDWINKKEKIRQINIDMSKMDYDILEI
jgi:hypothetical protein